MSEPQVEEGFVQALGYDISYRTVGECRSAMCLPLLCLAGGPGAPIDYLAPLEGLAGDRLVVFYDQLGCGGSANPEDPDLWTVDVSLRVHAEVSRALGLLKYHLLGQSWGGMLAMEYALPPGPSAWRPPWKT
jgi:proline-specific peptidase